MPSALLALLLALLPLAGGVARAGGGAAERADGAAGTAAVDDPAGAPDGEAAARDGERTDGEAAAPALLARPVVLGASVSRGFGLGRVERRWIALADLLDRALAAPHGEIATFATPMFFLDPVGTGGELMGQALAARPTVLVALDYLFWFGYGYLPEEARLPRLEQGLALLERYDGPVLVGDFPDVRRALDARVPMIVPEQVPTPETLQALNARLARWAAEDPARRIVVPLSTALDRLSRGEPLDLHGVALEPDEGDPLFQADLLHTTRRGTAALVLLALDGLARAELVDPAAVVWDPDVVADLEAAAAEPATR